MWIIVPRVETVPGCVRLGAQVLELFKCRTQARQSGYYALLGQAVPRIAQLTKDGDPKVHFLSSPDTYYVY